MDKILHIIDSGGFYGAEKVVLNLISAQTALGMRPVLLSLGDSGAGQKEIEVEGRKRGVEVSALRFRNGLNIKGAMQIRSKARETGAEIIHSHGYKANILLGMMPRRLRALPILSTLHGWTGTRLFSKIGVYETLDALALRRIDQVAVVSAAMLKHPLIRMAGICPEVVPNGLPLLAWEEKVFERTFPEVYTRCSGKFKILAIGRLSPEKGFDLLIRAVAQLAARKIDCCLCLAGEGNERAALTRLAQSERVDDRVHFLGYVPEAFRLLPSFDLFALPSRTEGMPLTVLEAMQANVPVIAARVGGVPEMLGDGKYGRLAAAESAEELAAGIETGVLAKEEDKARAREARKFVLEKYSLEEMARRYLELYERILVRQHPGKKTITKQAKVG